MTIDFAALWPAASLLALLAGIWWRLQQQITANARALDAYRLEAAEKYASVAHLKEVEARLVSSMDRLTSRIDRLLGRFDEMRKGSRP